MKIDKLVSKLRSGTLTAEEIENSESIRIFIAEHFRKRAINVEIDEEKDGVYFSDYKGDYFVENVPAVQEILDTLRLSLRSPKDMQESYRKIIEIGMSVEMLLVFLRMFGDSVELFNLQHRMNPDPKRIFIMGEGSDAVN